MTDIYSGERAGFLERLGRLAGQTTFREPYGEFVPPSNPLPVSHELAAALCYARGERWQPGPEIAYAVATGLENNRDAVINWLAEKLYQGTGAEGRRNSDRIRGIAAVSYALAVRGEAGLMGFTFDEHIMRLAHIGAGWLAACMERTIEIAERNESRKVAPSIAETA